MDAPASGQINNTSGYSKGPGDANSVWYRRIVQVPWWQTWREPEAFRYRLGISLLLSIPLFIFSPYLLSCFHIQTPQIAGSKYICMACGLLIYAYGGMMFLEGAFQEIRKGRPGVMTQAALAITLTTGYSVMATLGYHSADIYWETALLTIVLLLGHWLISRNLNRLLAFMNTNKCTLDSAHSDLAGMWKVAFLNAHTEDEQRNEQLSFWLLIATIIVSTISAVFWAFQGSEIVLIVERVASILVISSPSSFSLSYGLPLYLTYRKLAYKGIYVRSRRDFFQAGLIKQIMFGKTEVLTEGCAEVHRLYNLSSYSDYQLIQWAASVEHRSPHPFARAIVEYASANVIDLLESSEHATAPGIGVRARIENHTVTVGSNALLKEAQIMYSEERRSAERESSLAGYSIVYMLVDDVLAAVFALADVIRPEAEAAVSSLHHIGIKTTLVSGDSESVTQRMASQLDIHDYMAGIVPSRRAEEIRNLRQRNLVVAVIGDEIKDQQALAEADLAISIIKGEIPDEPVSGVMLGNYNLLQLPFLISQIRSCQRKIFQNQVFCSVYHLVALPIGAGILSFLGFNLPAAAAACIMLGANLILIGNSRLLRSDIIISEPAGSR